MKVTLLNSVSRINLGLLQLAAGATTTSETQPIGTGQGEAASSINEMTSSMSAQVAAAPDIDPVHSDAMEIDSIPARDSLHAGGSLAGGALPIVDPASFTQAQQPTSKASVGETSINLGPNRNRLTSNAACGKTSSHKSKSVQPDDVPLPLQRRSQRARSRSEAARTSRRRPSNGSVRTRGAAWDPCWCGDEDDNLDMVGCDGPSCRRFMHGEPE